ncbi:MAG: hypothetical protein HS101_12025 [Planctomycetia bacterium]|jgi:hypothetical protein|nr:hypothetical protein [Planctomycetia bacterium]MCC7314798.1 hypothetical protein [Planctomycetota bacterium]OQZ05421.1 MAG: hypothetical protein B6D36_10235 [Planctomycetes bacterium UTPLA1]
MSTQPLDFDEQGDLGRLDQLLIALYVQHATTVDALAYSETFDQIYDELLKAGEKRSKGEVFRRMLMLRKSGRLPRLDLDFGGPNESLSQERRAG